MGVAVKYNQKQFVDIRITRKKFEEQVDLFIDREVSYRKEGIICLLIEYPIFEFAFLSRHSVMVDAKKPDNALLRVYPFFLFAIRIDYTNYDILAPSIKIIDPFTSKETKKKAAWDVVITPNQQSKKYPLQEQFKEKGQKILINNLDGQWFFCLRGIREYHEHPQHNGDSWLLHRQNRIGNLLHILDQLQIYAISNFDHLIDEQIKLSKNG